MWAWGFRQRATTATTAQVRGFFGSDVVTDALVSFGFLEPKEDGFFRIRGSSRYMGAFEKSIKGGKARATGAKREAGKFISSLVQAGALAGPAQPPQAGDELVDTPARDQPDNQPATSPNQPLHQSPNTNHLAPLETLPFASLLGLPEEAKKSSGGKKPPADPRYTKLWDVMLAIHEQVRGFRYKPTYDKDGPALKAIMAVSDDDDDVMARWRWVLSLPSSKWPSCSTIAQLGSKWNDCAAPVGGTVARHDPNTGIIRGAS
jgi:hypothetical protein